MARRPVFGILVTDRQGNAVTNSGPPGGGGTLWTAKVGGTQLVDLIDNLRGGATDGFLSTDGFGEVDFQLPDDLTAEAWIDFGFGRFFVQSSDASDRIAALEASVATLLGQSSITIVQAPTPPAGTTNVLYIPTVA